MHAQRIVIIGAGPTGLGAGYRLKELGHNQFQIYERSNHVGGLASSFKDSAGFTWDVGGHVIFSHYKYYDKCFDELMGNDYQLNMRECWIRMMNTWVPYPFQNNIRYLPKDICFECLSGLVHAQTQRDHKSAKNFKEFMDAVFGDGIVKYFMEPYNFKVWAHPPHLLSKEWIGERVAVLDINRAMKNVVMQTDDFGWGPNNQFKFPLMGGTGEFYRRFEKPLAGHINLNKTVAFIDMPQKEVHFADGQRIPYDILISAMPLDILCNQILRGPVPSEVKKSAAALLHSGGYMVGIGFKPPCPSTKSWMYFPESNCPFYRATYLSNYSPNMTPDAKTHYSLLCETSFSPHKSVHGDRIVDETIAGLINAGMIQESDREKIVSTWVYHADYSYPTPSVDRDEQLAKAIPFLEHNDIYSRGRFGLWKYEVSNTDHTLMQGVELINRLFLNEPEVTTGMKYSSTHDGRNAAAHERSPFAGSGDPSRSKPRPTPAEKDEPHISEEELGITTTRPR
ncbi:MAG TPA: FAD-dependent oxidoreductase [Tepidisphaeraceae bacterium]|nr:FAD-dependent oxidoreductase [Tepidisphaeraceae bacterium]